jgi:hypothetical protein
MHVNRALDQISLIHDHLAKGEVYRGFRSLPVLLSGLGGLAAAVTQNWCVPPGAASAWILFWVVAAGICGAVGASVTAYDYFFRDDFFARRKTHRVAAQFAPALFAGAAVTLGLAPGGAPAVGFLPGLWSLIFGLGIFSARPYLPRAAGWVGLYYLLAGLLLFVLGRNQEFPPPGWHVGGVFALGQTAAGLMLYWNLERKANG